MSRCKYCGGAGQVRSPDTEEIQAWAPMLKAHIVTLHEIFDAEDELCKIENLHMQRAERLRIQREYLRGDFAQFLASAAHPLKFVGLDDE